ncbi:hypothetical protein K3N28_00520 [Glycomyces sp. TRM65418]|uniref:hypothetical protein n=1 Tax=Glycomyces sp. TRM65418 TaxID=2867006 RepID=UPI001CE5E0CC|nr:hypothetical protein [Glycomyces sp. TRM65418]MCC3761561.1 hypothetical protein [Glycomyces sp. TRM65418]QZD55659.1 hypothetical protein K3N28_00515 [Glycomyces sp. TRM65418]
MSSSTAVPWKSALMWVTAVIAAIALAGWFAVSCGPTDANAERPVSEEEAALLAGMRERNHDADPVAVRMSVPMDGETVIADGYLDWRLPMLYARVPDAEGDHRLVQAVPGLVATRADDEAAFAELRVPEDGWTTRQMLSGAGTPLETTFDILASSLFTLTAEQADDPAVLGAQATWREEGVIDGEPVDSFRAPIMVESDERGASPEALYSLDEEGNLRRFQVNTGEESLSAVDFLRDVGFDPTALVPVDLLGGPAIEPSAVDEDLAAVIAAVRERNWSRSATVELTVPTADGQITTGTGSIDWRTMTAYLHLTDAAGQRLFLARPGGYATLPVDDGELPETPPAEGWAAHALTDEDVAETFGPVESLVYRLLEMSAEEAEDAEAIAESAFLLRVDETDGGPVQVVEFPVAGDAEAAVGRSAFRYHLSDERLSEVEMVSYFGVASAELAYEDYPMVEIPWAVSEQIG